MFATFLLSLLALNAPAHARSVPQIAVIHQVMPAVFPTDPDVRFTCQATWVMPQEGDGAVSVAPDCAMSDAVLDAASQWRFGYRRLPKGDASMTVHAYFSYGEDRNGDVGWFYRMSAPQDPSAPVDADVVPLKALKKVVPDFPSAGKQLGDGTTVCGVQFWTDTRGRVKQALSYGCPEPFQISVLDAVEDWIFEPAIVDGKPVESDFDLKVTFTRK